MEQSLEDYTDQELKSHAYDTITKIEELQQSLQLIQRELHKRGQENALNPEALKEKAEELEEAEENSDESSEE